MSERLTKEQLKEDVLVKQTGAAVDFAQHHVRILVGGMAVVAIGIAAYFIVQSTAERSENKAAGMLVEAKIDLGKGNLEAAGRRLTDILESMGGTPSGKQAMLLYGNVCYAQGHYDEAITSYERAVRSLGKDPILGAIARRGLAASYENQGNHSKAAEVYEDLMANTENASLKADVGLDLARNYVKLGKDAEAERIYKQISYDPSNARAAEDARQFLEEIRALRAAG